MESLKPGMGSLHMTEGSSCLPTAFEVPAGIAFAGFLIWPIVIRVPRTSAADSPVVVEV